MGELESSSSFGKNPSIVAFDHLVPKFVNFVPDCHQGHKILVKIHPTRNPKCPNDHVTQQRKKYTKGIEQKVASDLELSLLKNAQNDKMNSQLFLIVLFFTLLVQL